ncbi:metallophosphoesterase [Clostridium bowmanii]|uniref:metallophosphoesterase n=1 Tax=Clostridium bowmanii TaxID=132925 RepID=UPI001C0D740E|nr:metallophosphoesterase [Clostridium bowmanii]MBU3191439.1 metallophosphoesterase [Clostridium bowmanii]MCA1075617.1 metallophosphoesterase [Clostridium bowmanii]
MFEKFLSKKSIIFIVVIMSLVCFSYFENNNIVISKYNINSNTLPKAFNNFKIVQISDLHNKVFYKDNNTLVAKIKSQKPDIIVITGDLVDRRYYNEEKAVGLINKIKSIAPIYYVNGNHEGLSTKFASLEKKLKERGVFVLRNKSIFYEVGNEKILISGIDDPVFSTIGQYKVLFNEDIMKRELLLVNNKKYYNILLSHRTEFFDFYVNNNIDLAFTGHSHGGQFIIPFIGGVFSPGQGFWPKYYKGMYTKDNTTMVVSRGLGNSVIPQRIFNRPEIVSVTLKAVEKAD